MSTITQCMGGSAEAAEILSHQIVRGTYCDIDFIVASINKEQNKKSRRNLKDEVIYSVMDYLGTFPFDNPPTSCRNNLYVKYDPDSEAFDLFMTKTLDRVLRKVYAGIKE